MNIFFPSRCPVCGNRSDNHLYNPFCTKCWRGIERHSGPTCKICGMPTVSSLTITCASCLKSPPPFSKVLYYGIYDGVLKEAIHLLKFNGIRRLSKPLSLLLAEMNIPGVDGIIPVPIYKKKLYKRGFNQTASIGFHLSKKMNIPLMIDVLKKIKDTLPQTEVTGKERLKNIRNAFSVSRDIDIQGLNLLLVDDVITTGATVRECAKALKDAGAKTVTVIALAHSMPKF